MLIIIFDERGQITHLQVHISILDGLIIICFIHCQILVIAHELVRVRPFHANFVNNGLLLREQIFSFLEQLLPGFHEAIEQNSGRLVLQTSELKSIFHEVNLSIAR